MNIFAADNDLSCSPVRIHVLHHSAAYSGCDLRTTRPMYRGFVSQARYTEKAAQCSST